MMGRKNLFLVIFIATAAGGGGCAAPRPLETAYREASCNLDTPLKDMLLEGVQVLALLENYRLSLEEKDSGGYLRCFSPDFSYYEKGLAWLRQRVEEDFFRRFDELSVSLSGIEIKIVKKESSFWLKQEAFDWLESREALLSFPGPYLILLSSESGTADILFETGGSPPPPPRSRSPSGGIRGSETSSLPLPSNIREPEKVAVHFRFDPVVDKPIGEVSFKLSLKARSRANGSMRREYTCDLKESIIFLLEKTKGKWRIVSRQ